MMCIVVNNPGRRIYEYSVSDLCPDLFKFKKADDVIISVTE